MCWSFLGALGRSSSSSSTGSTTYWLSDTRASALVCARLTTPSLSGIMTPPQDSVREVDL
eukprot:2535690-Prymnesium_polylepis.1